MGLVDTLGPILGWLEGSVETDGLAEGWLDGAAETEGGLLGSWPTTGMAVTKIAKSARIVRNLFMTVSLRYGVLMQS